MSDKFCLDDRFSTTKLLINKQPKSKTNSNNKFETMLFLPVGKKRQGEGGLRTKGYFKESFTNKPLVSIITVVYNGEDHIDETIQSVINQTYDNVEYIIIDGGSTDGTLDIIKKYDDQIDYWVSEKDAGIYDAMNKGIDLATGDWINFMNAGDNFFNKNILKQIFYTSNFKDIGVIYGGHEVRYPNKTRIAHAGNINSLWKGSQFSHQSAFTSTKYHKAYKLNTSNHIGADFEFFYMAYMHGVKFHFQNSTISSISSGGLSDIKRVDSIIGRWNVLEKNIRTNLYYIWLVLKEMCKEQIKRVVKIHLKQTQKDSI